MKRKFPGRGTIREHIRKQITPANKALPLVAYVDDEVPTPSGFDSATSFAMFKDLQERSFKASPKISHQPSQKVKTFRVLKHVYKGSYEIREA